MLTVLFIAALLGLLGDVLTTFAFLKLGGNEQNKLLKWFFGKIGVAPALIGSHALFALLLGYIGTQVPLLAPYAYGAATLGFGYLTVNNLLYIKKLQKRKNNS